MTINSICLAIVVPALDGSLYHSKSRKSGNENYYFHKLQLWLLWYDTFGSLNIMGTEGFVTTEKSRELEGHWRHTVKFPSKSWLCYVTFNTPPRDCPGIMSLLWKGSCQLISDQK